MEKWNFFNPFVGSNVPITYTQEKSIVDNFTGETYKVVEKRVIGYIFTEDVQKLMSDMRSIQEEVKR